MNVVYLPLWSYRLISKAKGQMMAQKIVSSFFKIFYDNGSANERYVPYFNKWKVLNWVAAQPQNRRVWWRFEKSFRNLTFLVRQGHANKLQLNTSNEIIA